MNTNFDAILAQLHNVKANGKGYAALCPAHDDQHRSLSIARADDGKILLHCFAGCETEAIARALGLKLSDLFLSNGQTRGGKVIATYDYTDERGALLYQCARFDPKDFRQRRPDGAGGWQWSLNGTRRVLYHLPELLARSDEMVFIVEGEKDADNLARVGLLATTNAGGANAWRDEYAETLRGRHVVIIPDNDDAGRQHAARVAHSLQDRAASIKILELPNLPPKGDVTDWLNAGGSKNVLLELAARASDTPQSDAAPYLPFDEILTAFQRAETGDAEILARLFADQIAYDHAENAWHLFRKHFWERDETGAVGACVANDTAAQYLFAAAEMKRRDGDGETTEKRIKELYARANGLRYRNKIANVLTLASSQSALALRGDEWDKNAMLLGCANGVLNLRYREFEFRNGAPRDFIRAAAPTQWSDLHTPAPRFEQFLQEIFAGDADLIAFAQRLFGYGITGMTTEHILPILCGEGRNGKNKLIESICYALGRGFSAPVASDVVLEQGRRNAESATPNLYALRGKRLLYLDESQEGARLNASQIKNLTGSEMITARPLHGAPVTFRRQFLLVLLTNNKPHLNADDYALRQRVLLIPFAQKFVDAPRGANERKRDPNLAEKLYAEASGILAWLVRGALEWQRDGLNPPAFVSAATDEYFAEEDTIAQFIAACCLVNPNAATRASELYAAYRQWADETGLSAMSGLTFGKRISKRFDKKRTERGIVYTGIGLLANM